MKDHNKNPQEQKAKRKPERLPLIAIYCRIALSLPLLFAIGFAASIWGGDGTALCMLLMAFLLAVWLAGAIKSGAQSVRATFKRITGI